MLSAPAIDTVNTFERPDAVKPAAFTGATIGADGTVAVAMPAKAVVVMELR
jgi:alpha-N-arabinofuranosidase